jgi:hypothetical protein
MHAEPLVLAATVAADERRWLEWTLKKGGFDVRGVHDAVDADGEVSLHAGRCVLIIDSGLLVMAHDSQWRVLRARHPSLGVVIRCLINGHSGIRQAEERTFEVHPDNGAALLDAVRALGVFAPAR